MAVSQSQRGGQRVGQSVSLSVCQSVRRPTPPRKSLTIRRRYLDSAQPSPAQPDGACRQSRGSTHAPPYSALSGVQCVLFRDAHVE